MRWLGALMASWAQHSERMLAPIPKPALAFFPASVAWSSAMLRTAGSGCDSKSQLSKWACNKRSGAKLRHLGPIWRKPQDATRAAERTSSVKILGVTLSHRFFLPCIKNRAHKGKTYATARKKDALALPEDAEAKAKHRQEKSRRLD